MEFRNPRFPDTNQEATECDYTLLRTRHCIHFVGTSVPMYTTAVLIPAMVPHDSNSYFPVLIPSVHTRNLSVLLGRVVYVITVLSIF